MSHMPLDDLYLDWLYGQIGSPEVMAPRKSFRALAQQLFHIEFTWTVPNDDNRVEDGRDLRYEFVDELDLEDVNPEWLSLGCSVLEMLIGLARRLAFEIEGEPRACFWILLENIKIHNYTDAYYKAYSCEEQVNEIITRVVDRTYSSSGDGGLFPLERPRDDQRKVELWYQLSAYLIEREEV